MSRSVKIIAATLFLIATMPALWGQGSQGTLNGTVLDPAGAVVPGASVVLVNKATGEEHKTTSTSAGAYTLPYVPSGTYQLRVTAPGFRTSEADNVIVRIAQTLTVNVTLEVGAVSEQVTVSDKPPLLESGTAEIGRYISVEEYKSWPIFVDDGQRQIQSFIFSSLPGTTGGTFEGSINGGQEYSHEILIEGIPVGRSDLSGGNNNEFSPSAEAISEFKLQTGAVSAQYNGGQTAVANFNIKSGTNDLHGTAFWYGQNEAFNAESIQDKAQGDKKPIHRENNEGFSLGGPVYIPKVYHGRNKTFWFVNYEKDHYSELSSSGFTTLPTPAFKTGDFSQLLNPAFTGNAQSGTQVGTDALGRPIIFGTIYDPKSTRVGPDGNPIRDAFPGNIIPPSRIDPVAANIVNKIGIQDPLLATMKSNIPNVGTCCPFFDLHIFGLKVDENIGDKHHISGYYNQSYRNRNNNGSSRYLPFPGPPTSSWQQQTTPGNMVRLSLNSTITPTILNRVAAGYNRFVNDNGALPYTVGKDLAGQIGIQNTSPNMFPTFSFNNDGAADYQGKDIGRMGVGFVDHSANGSYIYQDDLTWIHGKHSFRFGYQYSRYFYNDNGQSDSGAFRFSPKQTDLPGNISDTGHSFASFMLGAVRNATHGVNGIGNAGFRQPFHSFYAMDDWKLTPKLTMNIGLRWEVITPFYEVTGRMSEVDLNTPNPDAGNLPGALVFAGSGRNRFSDTYWKEFGPRLGVAYQLNNKTVIRAGYAMMNTPPIAQDWGYGSFLNGFNGSVNVRAGSSPTGFVDDPAMYLSQPVPSLAGALPDTNPSGFNGNDVFTTARDANRPGYVQNWNFTIQYQLPSDTVLEVAYVGNKGTRLWGAHYVFGELNGLPSSMLSMGDILNEPVSDHPQYLPYAGFDDTNTVSQALRKFPQFFAVNEQYPYNQNSNYNSLQVTVTRHLTRDLGFLAAYTWSKAIGYVDQNGVAAYYATVQDYYNRGLERSVTSFNLPQTFKLTWVYDLPVGKGKKFDLGWANYIVGGWKLAAIHNYLSGGALQLGESGVNAPPGFAGNIRPDVISSDEKHGGVPSKVDVFNGTPYLNPSAFATSPLTVNGTPLRVGTAPRFLSNVRGPMQLSEDFRISKRFPLWGEKRFFQIGSTWTNAFNRHSRYFQSLTVGDSNFGQLYAGGGPRRIQVDARIEF
jgi:hypothetical protein